MSTTTRAQCLAIAGVIGLALALPVPADAAPPEERGSGSAAAAQARSGENADERQKKQQHGRGQQPANEDRSRSEPRSQQGQPKHTQKPQAAPNARNQQPPRDQQPNKLQQAREQEQGKAKRPQNQANELRLRPNVESTDRKRPVPAPGVQADRDRAQQRPQGDAQRTQADHGRTQQRPQTDAQRTQADHGRTQQRPHADTQRTQAGPGQTQQHRQSDVQRDQPGDRGSASQRQSERSEPRSADRRRRFSENRKERRGNIEEIRHQRKERREEGGRIVIDEPGNRRIIRQGNRTIIRHDESERFRRHARDVDVQHRSDGQRVTTITRPNGVRIITVEDRNGRLLRRIRRGPDGREVVLIDNTRHHHHHRHDHGVDALSFFLDLAMPRVHIDRHYYIVDADAASEDDLYDALIAPPIEDIEREYSLDEIRYNYPLRARMRSVNLNTINFETGSWELDDQAFDKLDEVARAMSRALDRNPDEIFLIEGHTDAVGSEEDNLTLSDRRAESVAIALSDDFDIPSENLITQGYGEQYLLVDTQEAERRNRRVTIRRITPLLTRSR